MINTYQTSLPVPSPPPPVPPRMGRSSRAVLVPASASSLGRGKRLPRFLMGIVLLHLLLSIGGFYYLYSREQKDTLPQVEGKAFQQTQGHVSVRAMAHMIVKPPRPLLGQSGHLQWNMDHSVYRNINHSKARWLTVKLPGEYYVYSRVTFSKWAPKRALVSTVQLRETEKDQERDVMKAYCALANHSVAVCTASQMEVLTLKAGNQLSVWVEDLSLVDYEKGATAFGMYKL